MRMLTLFLALFAAAAEAQQAEIWLEIGRVDVKPDGKPSDQPGDHGLEASISDDGRWVIFASGASDLVAGDSNGVADIFARDMTNGTTVRLSNRPGWRRATHCPSPTQTPNKCPQTDSPSG